MRSASLDEIGDIGAPAGTRPWAVALRMRMHAAIKDERSSAKHLHNLMALISDHKGYQSLEGPDGEPFVSFESFCKSPMPWGLGYELDAINGIINERKSAEARAREPITLHSHGGDRSEQGKNLTLKQRGEDSDYLTARIARDHPIVLDDMRNGKFKSVRQAARAAGIVRPRVSVYTDDPDAAATFLSKHFSRDDIRKITDLALFLIDGKP